MAGLSRAMRVDASSLLTDPGGWTRPISAFVELGFISTVPWKFGKTLDFMLSKRRNKPAAIKFLARAMEANGLPRKIVIDKSAANTEGIREIKRMLKRFGCPVPIELMRIKYLNNLVEQDHRFIKRRVRPMLGFKSFASAASTIAGIERECPELCVSDRLHAVSDTQASKRSPNIMANWLRAANHSRTFRPSFSKLRMAR